ncbi:NAD(P)/FAD-dependent oxidoreductase [Taklimakanibacter lacteus]|uniref:NAD(P)/FAD-dependent oxidoreductase n=1 Tax=Taklimakanibacter lacteus TaxID=2268456 RepID=UPI000E672D31
MSKIEEQDIGWRSHWLRQALAESADLTPPLQGNDHADLCIAGGGYLGLWTALKLKAVAPELDIVILEKDICGGGASGRNSGMLLGAWAKFSALSALRGEEEALRIIRASQAAIDDIAAFCGRNAIDCWFDRVGWIWGATCEAQRGAWDDALTNLARHGVVSAREVTRHQIAELTGSERHVAGVLDPSAATIHPGFLARGLRQAAIRAGVRIFEKSPMLRFGRKSPITIVTPGGQVIARKLVLALNAWSGGIRELAPAIFNISSDDAVSKPMPEMLRQAGYARGPLMIDSRVFVSGYRVTRDGRLNVGVTGGHIGLGGIVDRRFDAPSRRVSDMRQALREGHPALADFALDSAWSGAIDRTASGLPLFGSFPANPDILYGYGFSGNGIGMTFLGGSILASLVMERADQWSDCALVRPVSRGFPPEPFRFIGAHLVRGAVRRRDHVEHLGRKAGPIITALARLAPSGVTPSKVNIARKEARR